MIDTNHSTEVVSDMRESQFSDGLRKQDSQSRPSQFCLKEGVMIHIANV